MGFLIRLGFWFSLVLLILPLGTGQDVENGPSVGPLQAFFAARDAVSDVAGICERKPEVCEVGRSALETIGARALVAYEFFDSQFVGTDQSVATGSVQPAPVETETKTGAMDDRATEESTAAVPIPTERPRI